MADDQEQDKQQKTEEATAHRLEEATKKGQVPISREISHWMNLFAGALIISVIAPYFMSQTTITLKGFLAFHNLAFETGHQLIPIINDLLISVGKLMFMPIIIIMAAGLFAGFAQTKFAISFEGITPKFDKLSILKGFKRIFSTKALFEFGKGMLKITIIGVVVMIVLTPELSRLPILADFSPAQILGELQAVLTKLFIATLSVMGVLALLDYFFQRFQHAKQLRMSKQDIKDEQKSTDGDPLIKQRLAQLRHDRFNSRNISRVSEATVIITNPTHYAVALLYEASEMEAPIVVAKGMNLLALEMRQIAGDNNIPIIENPPLARALYASVETDNPIPSQYYTAVAHIIRYIMGIDKQLNNEIGIDD